MYDCIIIGSGIAGAAAARVLAEDQGRKVLVLEKKHHIGGNCYDGKDEYGILVHWYGPHIFHTGNEEVYEWLSRFTEWYAFGHEVVARVGDKLLPVPFNLNTLKMVYGEEKAAVLEKKLVDTFGFGARVPILKLREHEDPEIREIADYVYENIFLHYTMKQWGQTPEEIDPAVTGRVPVVISRDNRYFKDKYQGVPLEGFTAMYERMLDHENITLRLSTDADSLLAFSGNQVLFEGKPFDGEVIFTKDTHFENYMDTQEGHFLPVPHCIKGTDGWDLIPELEKIAIERDAATYEKITFGCPELAEDLLERNKKTPIESIELVGLCTDICVVSNALLIKAFLPETPVFVDSACAAGVTRERHEAALETMRSCQIVVK